MQSFSSTGPAKPSFQSRHEKPPTNLGHIIEREELMTDVRCAVCGKPISKNESRYVDVKPGTNLKIQVHTACQKKIR
jgi:hypothetical protein